MSAYVEIGDRRVGPGYPVYIIAEVGINHNGDLSIAKQLIDAAKHAGCDAVKFQKRTPDQCVPTEQRDTMRDTPWGHITYMEYRHRVEFGEVEYREIDQYCQRVGISWFASCWDQESVDFMEQFDPICHKVASASLTNHRLLKGIAAAARPVILSTGMSTMEQIRQAVRLLPMDRLLIAHCTSTYPCPPSELNLRMILALQREFDCPIGYSGHEVGLPTAVAAVAMGVCFIERHITLDRAMWGSDQAASVEPHGFERLVKYIRVVEQAMGDGVKRVYESEQPILRRLRLTDSVVMTHEQH